MTVAKEERARLAGVIARFGMNRHFWRRLADAGKVTAIRVNGQRLFDLGSVAQYLQEGDIPTASGVSRDSYLRRLGQRLREGGDE